MSIFLRSALWILNKARILSSKADELSASDRQFSAGFMMLFSSMLIIISSFIFIPVKIAVTIFKYYYKDNDRTK